LCIDPHVKILRASIFNHPYGNVVINGPCILVGFFCSLMTSLLDSRLTFQAQVLQLCPCVVHYVHSLFLGRTETVHTFSHPSTCRCHSHLPDGQGPRKVVYQLNQNRSKQKLAKAKQNLRAACSKSKLNFNFFFFRIEHIVSFAGQLLRSVDKMQGGEV